MEPYDPRPIANIKPNTAEPSPISSNPKPTEPKVDMVEIENKLNQAWETRTMVCEGVLSIQEDQPLNLPEDFMDNLSMLEADAKKFAAYAKTLELLKDKDPKAEKLWTQTKNAAEADTKIVESIHNLIEDNNMDVLRFDICQAFMHKLDYDITDTVYDAVENKDLIDFIKEKPQANYLEFVNSLKKAKPQASKPKEEPKQTKLSTTDTEVSREQANKVPESIHHVKSNVKMNDKHKLAAVPEDSFDYAISGDEYQ